MFHVNATCANLSRIYIACLDTLYAEKGLTTGDSHMKNLKNFLAFTLLWRKKALSKGEAGKPSTFFFHVLAWHYGRVNAMVSALAFQFVCS